MSTTWPGEEEVMDRWEYDHGEAPTLEFTREYPNIANKVVFRLPEFPVTEAPMGKQDFWMDSWESAALFLTLLAFFPLLVVVIPVVWFSLLSKLDTQPEAKGLFNFVSFFMAILVLGGALLALLAGPMTAGST